MTLSDPCGWILVADYAGLYAMSDSVGPTYAMGTLNNGQPERGKTLFTDHCAVCHGKEGQGGVVVQG